MLDWREEYVDQRVADTPSGTYRVDDADSLGRREVTFTNKDGQHFIGTCMASYDGMNLAQQHALWFSKLQTKATQQEG